MKTDEGTPRTSKAARVSALVVMAALRRTRLPRHPSACGISCPNLLETQTDSSSDTLTSGPVQESSPGRHAAATAAATATTAATAAAAAAAARRHSQAMMLHHHCHRRRRRHHHHRPRRQALPTKNPFRRRATIGVKPLPSSHKRREDSVVPQQEYPDPQQPRQLHPWQHQPHQHQQNQQHQPTTRERLRGGLRRPSCCRHCSPRFLS